MLLQWGLCYSLLLFILFCCQMGSFCCEEELLWVWVF